MAETNAKENFESSPFQCAEVLLDVGYLQSVENLNEVLKTGKQNSVNFKAEHNEFKATGSWKDLDIFREQLIKKRSNINKTVLTKGQMTSEAVTIIHKLIDDTEWGDKDATGVLKKQKCNAAMILWVIGKYCDKVKEIKKSITMKIKSSSDEDYRLSLKGSADKVEQCFKEVFKLCDIESDKLDGCKFDFGKDFGEPISLEVLDDLEQFQPVMTLVNGAALYIVIPKQHLESCRTFMESIVAQVNVYEERVSSKARQIILSFCESLDTDGNSEENNREYPHSQSTKINDRSKDYGLSSRKLQGDSQMMDYIIHVYKNELQTLEDKYDVSIDDSQVEDGILIIIANDEESSRNISAANDAIADKIQSYHFDFVIEEVNMENISQLELTREKINKLAKRNKIRAKIDKEHSTVRFIAVENMDDFLKEVKELLILEPAKPKRIRTLVPEESSFDLTENDMKVNVPSRKFHIQPDPLNLMHAASGISIHTSVADITKLNVDVIVNAANEHLDHGGGVAYAISKAAGYRLHKECSDHIRVYGPLKISSNCITSGGSMPCKKVIHAVGPRWNKHSDQLCFDQLRDTFANVLKTAIKNQFTSIAITSISSGIYGMPKHHVAEIMVTSIVDFLDNITVSSLTHIHLVDIDYEMIHRIQGELNQVVQKGDLNPNTNEIENSDDEEVSGAVSGTKRERRLLVKPDNENPVFQSRYSTKGPNEARDDTGKDYSEKELDDCCICLGPIANPKTLKCKHTFCTECIDRGLEFKPVCPKCGEIFGALTGNQPPGTMEISKDYKSLPGYYGCGNLTIHYNIPSGTQTDQHPKPGKKYHGCGRTAYLPDNTEGHKVAGLLKQAFDSKLIFTVGRSVTSGQEDVVTWNDIHHKTNIHGGAHGFGYPDPDYLRRVQEELAAKGIK